MSLLDQKRAASATIRNVEGGCTNAENQHTGMIHTLAVGLLLVFPLVTYGIEVRYLASNGDDSKDGKSPETAWRTVERLNASLPPGGVARLRCGDVFYGQIEVSGGIDKEHRTVVKSFGSGA